MSQLHTWAHADHTVDCYVSMCVEGHVDDLQYIMGYFGSIERCALWNNTDVLYIQGRVQQRMGVTTTSSSLGVGEKGLHRQGSV